MSNIAILVEGLGKRYRIGAKQEKYKTLRDTLTNGALRPFRVLKSLTSGNGHRNSQPTLIWALKDVSFEVKPGEVVGIIGRNGAGKSTLLKVLSRITEPTEGYADINGRVASLLEVGTGFHQELTGRENIYLNGAILGMKRKEIERKFDEIVAFAEVEKFIDTPVKHYSSGMYLRLAFGVAAHLEPEILLVDEVLAVGDAAFQKKCVGKMHDVAVQGKTVIFVSHNMEAVLTLCSKSLLLNEGKIVFEGQSAEAVSLYRKGLSNKVSLHSPHVIYDSSSRSSSADIEIARVEMLDSKGHPKNALNTWDDVIFRIHYLSHEEIRNGSIVIEIRDYKDQRLIVLDSGIRFPIRKGVHFIDCFLPKLPLAAGEYFLGAGLALSNNQWLWRDSNLGFLQVEANDVFELGRPPVYSRMMFVATHKWIEGN
jgi:homopolymeric O-antigen transport system ATP-binding protein